MGRFIGKRILRAIPVLILTLVISFFVIHIMSGDPVLAMLGDKASESQIEEMREKLNLNEPIFTQFVIWVKGVVTLDFGDSITQNKDVLQLIGERLEPTVILAVMGIILSVVIGIPLGILSANTQGRWVQKLLSILALVSISVPAFVLAIVLIQLLAVNLRIFPVASYHSIKSSGLATAIYDLMLPSIILGIMHCGQIARMTKSTMMNVLDQDYMRTARAKGVKEIKVLTIHGLKNALPSILVVIGNTLASLLAGAVVIEQMFNLPGIGNLMINAILARDYPLIQGSLLVVGVIFISMNLLTDLLCGLINPKVRYEDA